MPCTLNQIRGYIELISDRKNFYPILNTVSWNKGTLHVEAKQLSIPALYKYEAPWRVEKGKKLTVSFHSGSFACSARTQESRQIFPKTQIILGFFLWMWRGFFWTFAGNRDESWAILQRHAEFSFGKTDRVPFSVDGEKTSGGSSFVPDASLSNAPCSLAAIDFMGSINSLNFYVIFLITCMWFWRIYMSTHLWIIGCSALSAGFYCHTRTFKRNLFSNFVRLIWWMTLPLINE